MIDSGPRNVRAILTEAEQNRVRVTLVPTDVEESAPKEPNWWLHGILFLITLATTTWAGALQQGVNILQASRLVYPTASGFFLFWVHTSLDITLRPGSIAFRSHRLILSRRRLL